MVKKRFNTKWAKVVFDRLDFICEQNGMNRSRALEEMILEKFNNLKSGHTVGHTNERGVYIGGQLDNLCLSINTLIQEIKTKKRGKGERKIFIPPTKDEVKGEMIDLGWSESKSETESIKFMAYYANTEWKLSGGKGAKMKDWKAAVNYWKTNNKPNGNKIDTEALNLPAGTEPIYKNS